MSEAEATLSPPGETLEGTAVEGWHSATLEQFVRIKHGYAFGGELITSEPTPNVLVTPGNFHIGGGFKSAKFKYYAGDVPEGYKLKAGDIVVTMTDLSKDGDTLGYGAKIPPSNDKTFLHNQRIGLVQFTGDAIDRDFLYWVLRTREYQGYVLGAATGTSVRHTSPSTIQRYKFMLPDSPSEQRSIAEALTGLDAKIDLLRRQNETLETMADMLFRQWFVDAAQDDWVEYSLRDFADHLRQGVIPGDQPSTDFLHFSLPAFDAGQRAVVEPGAQILSNKFSVPEGVLLVSKLNPRVSRVWPIDQLPAGIQAVCSTEFQVLKPKNPAWFGYLYGLLTSNEARDALTMAASGTSGSHQRVRPEDILGIKTTLPNLGLAEEFSSWVEPLMSKRQHNIEQMGALERTRDTLLPKLMSGEVRVAS